jgi:hypothetical protein
MCPALVSEQVIFEAPSILGQLSALTSVATAQCGSASARLHRLITQNGAARSAKLVTGSAAMAKSGLAAARSRLLYQ